MKWKFSVSFNGVKFEEREEKNETAKKMKEKMQCNYVKEVHDASLYDITKPWCNVVSHSKPFPLCNVKLAVEHSTS